MVFHLYPNTEMTFLVWSGCLPESTHPTKTLKVKTTFLFERTVDDDVFEDIRS